MKTDLQCSWEFIRSFERDFNKPEDRHALETRLLGMNLMPTTEVYCMGAIDRYERFMLHKKHRIPKQAGWPVSYEMSNDTITGRTDARERVSVIFRCFNRIWMFLFSP